MPEEREMPESVNDYYELRYNDLKQFMEAMTAYFPPEVLDENATFRLMEAEFNYLADMLGYEDMAAFLDRLIANDERSLDDDDDEMDSDDDDDDDDTDTDTDDDDD
jgi:RNA polymerase primary sigma factor